VDECKPLVMGKVAAMMGKEGDATPFTPVTVENISDMLHQCGYQKRGNEVMYNGRGLHSSTFQLNLSWF